MRQLRVSRAFVGLSLLLSCLVLHFLFSKSLFNKSDLGSQSVYVNTADSSGLHSIGPSVIVGSEIKSKTLPLDIFHNGPLGLIQHRKSNVNGVHGKVNSKISRSSKLILLSSNRSVTSDVQGNLGSPSVITSESVSNWLTDRWQAASNMGGRPIPGPHFVEVDLGRLCYIEKVLIDWEDGYSDSWTLEGRASQEVTKDIIVLGQSAYAIRTSNFHRHIIYELDIQCWQDEPPPEPSEYSLEPPNLTFDTELKPGDRPTHALESGVRYVRLTIHAPATEWGSSIWRLQIWGYEANQ